MTTNEAQKAGIVAYMAGKPLAPALNRSFIVPACKSGRFCEIAKAYINGWTVAHLAAGATPEMPSSRRLMEILAA